MSETHAVLLKKYRQLPEWLEAVGKPMMLPRMHAI